MVKRLRKEAKDTLNRKGSIIDWDSRKSKEEIPTGRGTCFGGGEVPLTASRVTISLCVDMCTDTARQQHQDEPFVNPPRYAVRRQSTGGSSDAQGEFDGPLLLINSLDHWNILLKEKILVSG